MARRRERRRKRRPENLNKTRRYWKFKEKALHCAFWRTGFGRGYGSVV